MSAVVEIVEIVSAPGDMAASVCSPARPDRAKLIPTTNTAVSKNVRILFKVVHLRKLSLALSMVDETYHDYVTCL